MAVGGGEKGGCMVPARACMQDLAGRRFLLAWSGSREWQLRLWTGRTEGTSWKTLSSRGKVCHRQGAGRLPGQGETAAPLGWDATSLLGIRSRRFQTDWDCRRGLGLE